MPETPDVGPRRRWALENATVRCTVARTDAVRSELAQPQALFGSISMQTGLSIGGVHHAEEEQEGAKRPQSASRDPAILRWALLMRAIK